MQVRKQLQNYFINNEEASGNISGAFFCLIENISKKNVSTLESLNNALINTRSGIAFYYIDKNIQIAGDTYGYFSVLQIGNRAIAFCSYQKKSMILAAYIDDTGVTWTAI